MEISRDLVAAAKTLELSPRDHTWRSLTSCVLDAVWSIGITYDTKVVPYVRNVFSLMDGGDPLTDQIDDPGPDPTSLSAFRARFSTPEELIAATSGHRTSTTSGIRKAEAALRYADVLLAHEVDTLADARACPRKPGASRRRQRGTEAGPGGRRAHWILLDAGGSP